MLMRSEEMKNRSPVSLSSWKDFEYNDQILGDLLENDSILANT